MDESHEEHVENEELEDQHAEPLPDREVMTILPIEPGLRMPPLDGDPGTVWSTDPPPDPA